MIDAEGFWQLAKATRSREGGYFEEGVKRAFELAADLPPNCLAWMKVEWPRLELYLYEPDDGTTALEKVKATYDVHSAVRPTDHGHIMSQDWIVKVNMP